MNKTHSIVMLSTQKASDVFTVGKSLHYKKDSAILGNGKNQNLYIISNDEIKEGDWFYNPATKEVLFASKDMLSWNSATTQEHKGWKKIVATTDKLALEPFQGFETESGEDLTTYLPEIPESFILAYIKAYNEGNQIKEVDLEMVLWTSSNSGNTADIMENGHHGEIYKVKTRPDGSVIIHQSKMYSREEVFAIIGFVRSNNFVFEKLALTNTEVLDQWAEANL